MSEIILDQPVEASVGIRTAEERNEGERILDRVG